MDTKNRWLDRFLVDIQINIHYRWMDNRCIDRFYVCPGEILQIEEDL